MYPHILNPLFYKKRADTSALKMFNFILRRNVIYFAMKRMVGIYNNGYRIYVDDILAWKIFRQLGLHLLVNLFIQQEGRGWSKGLEEDGIVI